MKSVYEACYYGGLALTILFVIVTIVLFVMFKIPRVIGDLTGRNAKKSMKSMNETGADKNVESKKERAKYYNEETGKIKVRQATAEKKSGLTSALKRKDSSKNRDEESTEILSNVSGISANHNTNADSDKLKKEVKFTTKALDDEATDVLRGSLDDEATDVLRGSADDEATDVLRGSADDEATDVLRSSADDEATDVLRGSADDEATDVLRGTADDEATDVLRGTADDDATDVLRNVDTDDDSTTVLSNIGNSGKLTGNVKVIYNIIEVHTDETL